MLIASPSACARSSTEPFVAGDGEVFLAASIGVIVSDGRRRHARRDCSATPTSRCSRPRSSAAAGSSCSTTPCATAPCGASRSKAALRRALVRGEFRVHYQPVVAVRPSEMIGIEALVRWEHPELGLLEPADFLAIAEETGLIVPIGAWVLHEACSQAARWCAESAAATRRSSVAVNLSARQLDRPRAGLDRRIRARGDAASIRRCWCSRSPRPSSSRTARRATEVLRQLAARGVRIGIDDFGTGQSSLAHLRVAAGAHAEDRPFVRSRASASDPEDAAIVSAIVRLGHALGFTVTAEGIETTCSFTRCARSAATSARATTSPARSPVQIVRALVHHRFRWSERDVSA